MNVNIIFATIGLLLFALSLYLFFGNFGELDKELFIGIGLVLTFTGLSVMLASCLGCQGAVNQNEKFGKSLAIFQAQISLCDRFILICLLFWL